MNSIFLDKSSIVEIALSDYSYSEMKTESFAVASSACPNCGKILIMEKAHI